MKKYLMPIFAVGAIAVSAIAAHATSITGTFNLTYSVANPTPAFNNTTGLSLATSYGFTGGNANGGTGSFNGVISSTPNTATVGNNPGNCQNSGSQACGATTYSATTANSETFNVATGFSSPVTLSDPYSTATFNPNSFNFGAITGSVLVGTFTETAAPVHVITSTTTDEIYYILGTFTGGTPDPGTNSMSILLSITANNPNNGGGISVNGPSAVPAVGLTPEPGSLVLLGTGMLGAAGLLRRRMRA